jgi:ribosomal protein L6P/L9E
MLIDCPNETRIFVRKSQRQYTISFFSSTLFNAKNLASKIIRYRPVSPYTGKGLIWYGTKILRKEGKGQFKR